MDYIHHPVCDVLRRYSRLHGHHGFLRKYSAQDGKRNRRTGSGNRILMSKYVGRAYKNYALLAGFSEIGEPVEETVRREVMEEVGLKVGRLHYYKSQPWSFTDTLLMGFFAELEGGEDIVLDQTELAMAEWFEREEIPVTYEDCSLTNEMIMAFKEHKITWSES